MGEEIERKFIADLEKFTLGIENYSFKEIIQGYLGDKEGLERRVRKEGEVYTYNEKGAGNVKRSENEIKISKGEFERLWEETRGKRLEKTRYYIPFVTINKTIHLDVYHGTLDGLVTAEIEFESVEEAYVKMPHVHWFVKEITKDRHYKNRHLAENGLPENISE